MDYQSPVDIKLYLDEKRDLVEAAMARYMLPATDPHARHVEAMRYSLFAGGKRVRPILFLAAVEALDADGTPFLPIACALECIHTYSLIHDDLPAMDNDDLRRGKPTNHKVYGEAEAILAGDGLLTFAFELMSATDLADRIGAERRLRIINTIARAAGPLGMVGGQALDLAAEGREIDLDHLRRIHGCKTGALITASIQAGALAGAAAPQQFEALSRYGMNIGLAFQIVDDLLNVEGDPADLGKAAGSDAERHKATYPSLLGLEETRRRADAAATTAIESLSILGRHAEPLRALAGYIITRKK